MKVIEKYLDTKNKKIAAGVTAAVIIAAVWGGTYWALRDTAPELLLKNSKTITVEYGEKYEPKFENLVKTNGLDKEDVHTLQHNTKITSDLKNEKVEIKDEAGNVTGVEEKEYPAVGKYTIELKYDGDTFKQKVEVKDTKAPSMTAPENIEILQGTDLNTFDFKSLLPVTDFSEISDYTFDLSGIDANVPGEYTLKASIQDKYENKTEKDVKVTVTAPPAVASDEVVVQEEVTNPDGTKSIKNTVKKKTDAGGNKVVSSGSGSSGGTGSSNSSGTAGGNSGTTGGNTGGSNKPSGGGSTGGNSGGSSSGGSSSGGNTGGSTGGSTGGGSNEEKPPKPSKVTVHWVRCKLCGKYVESTISLDDAFSKLKGYECESNGFIYDGIMAHSSYSYGFYEK